LLWQSRKRNGPRRSAVLGQAETRLASERNVTTGIGESYCSGRGKFCGCEGVASPKLFDMIRSILYSQCADMSMDSRSRSLRPLQQSSYSTSKRTEQQSHARRGARLRLKPRTWSARTCAQALHTRHVFGDVSQSLAARRIHWVSSRSPTESTRIYGIPSKVPQSATPERIGSNPG
jgi:hypothetical protein